MATTRLGRDDWVRVGLTALGEGGLDAVRVEPIAARLGATKGSFYWHFRHRSELLDAVLALWEHVGTEAVIAELATLPGPRERLRALFELTFAGPDVGPADTALLAAARDPRVAPVLDRVTRRRLEYMAEQLASVGMDRPTARRRSLQAYQAWLGLLQLRSAVPQVIPRGSEGAAYLRSVLDHLDVLLTP